MLSSQSSFEPLESRRLLSAGRLDPHWGDGGIFVGAMPMASAVITAIAATPDGKIMAAGTHSQEGANYVFFSRFLHDGSLDTTFGDGRSVPRGSMLTTLLAQPDSQLKIYSNGFFLYVASTYMARFTTEGAPDSSFGGTGLVTNLAVGAFNVALQSNNAIVIAGHRSGGAALARYRSNGLRDQTFGQHGVVTLPLPVPTSAALDVRILDDGKILFGTRYSHHRYDVNNSEDEVWSLQSGRVNPDGSLDSTYGTNGMSAEFRVQLFAQFNRINNNHALFTADGGTLITWQSDSAFGMCTFTADGAKDTSWNPNAFKSNPLLGEDSTSAFAQSDGKILVMGNDKLGRLLENGSTDTIFGDQGLTITCVNGRPIESVTTTVGNDGAIYVGGSVGGRYVIARYWRDDAPAAQLFAQDQLHAGNRSYRFSVTLRDDVAVNMSSIQASAFRIIGPDGTRTKPKLISITPLNNRQTVSVQLKVAGQGGTWDVGDNGLYQVQLLPDLIADTSGHLTGGRILGTFRTRVTAA